ncbi:MAG: hypothetical protein ACRCXY_03530 [Fusobacteriaceae bacterium]
MFSIGRLDKNKIYSIRIRYEHGENLKDLALEFKVPLITIHKRKKKSELKGDPWVKGFRSIEGFKEFSQDNESAKLKLDMVITEKARKEFISLERNIDRLYSDKNTLLIPEAEKAFQVRGTRIVKQLELRRKIEGIYTPEQQLLIDTAKATIKVKEKDAELKALEIKSKEIDYKLKEEESRHYLKGGNS